MNNRDFSHDVNPCLQRSRYWPAINAAIGLGALALSVALLILLAYIMITEPGRISSGIEWLAFGHGGVARGCA